MLSGSQRNHRFEHYLKDAAAVLDLLIEKRDARILLIPMDITPNPRDDLVCHLLKNCMVNKDSVKVLDDDPPLAEFIRRLGELDLLVSARLHGIILGLRFGLPFIGIDSDGKIERLASSIGYSDYVIKDFDFNHNTFYDLACRALDQYRELRQDLLRHGALMRNRANENRILLERCLGSIGGR
jgi:polysaccharide pyruvyl transferase WcaK-like protein